MGPSIVVTDRRESGPSIVVPDGRVGGPSIVVTDWRESGLQLLLLMGGPTINCCDTLNMYKYPS